MSSKTTSAICWENNILFKKVHILGLKLKKNENMSVHVLQQNYTLSGLFWIQNIHFLKQNIIFSTGGACCLRTHKLL